MSNNLKTVNLPNLTYKLIYDSTLDATPLIDVTQGSGYLYSFAVANTDAQDAGCFKLSLSATTVTVGGNTGTSPDIQVKVAASTTVRVTIPGGVPYTKLSCWQTTDPSLTSSTATSSAFAVYLTTT